MAALRDFDEVERDAVVSTGGAPGSPGTGSGSGGDQVLLNAASHKAGSGRAIAPMHVLGGELDGRTPVEAITAQGSFRHRKPASPQHAGSAKDGAGAGARGSDAAGGGAGMKMEAGPPSRRPPRVSAEGGGDGAGGAAGAGAPVDAGTAQGGRYPLGGAPLLSNHSVASAESQSVAGNGGVALRPVTDRPRAGLSVVVDSGADSEDSPAAGTPLQGAGAGAGAGAARRSEAFTDEASPDTDPSELESKAYTRGGGGGGGGRWAARASRMASLDGGDTTDGTVGGAGTDGEDRPSRRRRSGQRGRRSTGPRRSLRVAPISSPPGESGSLGGSRDALTPAVGQASNLMESILSRTAGTTPDVASPSGRMPGSVRSPRTPQGTLIRSADDMFPDDRSVGSRSDASASSVEGGSPKKSRRRSSGRRKSTAGRRSSSIIRHSARRSSLAMQRRSIAAAREKEEERRAAMTPAMERWHMAVEQVRHCVRLRKRYIAKPPPAFGAEPDPEEDRRNALAKNIHELVMQARRAKAREAEQAKREALEAAAAATALSGSKGSAAMAAAKAHEAGDVKASPVDGKATSPAAAAAAAAGKRGSASSLLTPTGAGGGEGGEGDEGQPLVTRGDSFMVRRLQSLHSFKTSVRRKAVSCSEWMGATPFGRWFVPRYSVLAAETGKITNSGRFKATIMGAIMLASVMVGVQTYEVPADMTSVMTNYLEPIVQWAFVAELVLKIVAEGLKPWTYFMDGWNVFDFLIVASSFLPIGASQVTILRLLRLLRVLKLVKALPQLQMLVVSLLNSMSSIGYISLLMFMQFYLWGVLGVILFGKTDPAYFGDLHTALVSLWQAATGDDWSDHLYTAAYGCASNLTPDAAYGHEVNVRACDQSAGKFGAGLLTPTLYYVSFQILASLMLLNLFVGAIMMAVAEAKDEVASGNMLTVTVVRAEELVAADIGVAGFGGRSDPYVTLTMRDKSHRTKVKKNTLTAEFNQSFDFWPLEEAGNTLSIHVWDWDRFGKDDPLGYFHINTEELLFDREYTFRCELNGTASGYVTVRCLKHTAGGVRAEGDDRGPIERLEDYIADAAEVVTDIGELHKIVSVQRKVRIAAQRGRARLAAAAALKLGSVRSMLTGSSDGKEERGSAANSMFASKKQQMLAEQQGQGQAPAQGGSMAIGVSATRAGAHAGDSKEAADAGATDSKHAAAPGMYAPSPSSPSHSHAHSMESPAHLMLPGQSTRPQSLAIDVSGSGATMSPAMERNASFNRAIKSQTRQTTHMSHHVSAGGDSVETSGSGTGPANANASSGSLTLGTAGTVVTPPHGQQQQQLAADPSEGSSAAAGGAARGSAPDGARAGAAGTEGSASDAPSRELATAAAASTAASLYTGSELDLLEGLGHPAARGGAGLHSVPSDFDLVSAAESAMAGSSRSVDVDNVGSSRRVGGAGAGVSIRSAPSDFDLLGEATALATVEADGTVINEHTDARKRMRPRLRSMTEETSAQAAGEDEVLE